jgi:hypothetical protein
MSTANGYAQKVIEALYENGDPVSIDAAELLERLTENAEPEAEPVGYAVKMIPRGLHFVGFVGEEETDEEIEEYGPDQIVPLYTRPSPARKPMTEEEIRKGYYTIPWPGYSDYEHFEAGIRFGEKHHEIGRGME